MAVLEGLVILTIILAAGFIGYHTWQDWLQHDEAESHMLDPGRGAVEIYLQGTHAVQRIHWAGTL